ncbi:hypothetical protein MRX96_016080 [Rhipicephalus microplus]
MTRGAQACSIYTARSESSRECHIRRGAAARESLTLPGVRECLAGPVFVCLNIHSASSVASPKAQTSGGHHRRWHSSLLSEDFIEDLLFGVPRVICERGYGCGVSRWQRGTSSDVTVRRHRWRAVAAAADGGCSRGSAVRCAGKPHTLSVSCLVRLSRPSSYRVVIEMDMGTRRESEELALVVSDPPLVRDAPAASGVRNLPLADGSSFDDAGPSRETPDAMIDALLSEEWHVEKQTTRVVNFIVILAQEDTHRFPMQVFARTLKQYRKVALKRARLAKKIEKLCEVNSSNLMCGVRRKVPTTASALNVPVRVRDPRSYLSGCDEKRQLHVLPLDSAASDRSLSLTICVASARHTRS